MPLTDKQKAIYTFRFLMNPQTNENTKQDVLRRMAGSPDKKSYNIAKYLADPDGNANVKNAIMTIMELSQDELNICLKLIGGS